MKSEEKIRTLRKRIDALDEKLLKLLNERAETVLRVGKVKKGSKKSYYNPAREKEIFQRLENHHSGPFPRWAISSVFREIVSACRGLEANLTVAYFGPPATFSHMACIQHFGRSVQTVPENSIQDVFEAVERGKTDYGVVPIENSTEGPVGETLDMLIKSEVKICSEIMIRISHDLLSRRGRAGDIEKTYSHPQALAQCRDWLREHFPRVRLEEAGSTAKAAQLAMEDPRIAAIASPLAGQLYKLKAVASQIEDNPNNFTRFLVLGRKDAERTGRDKTSILFSIPHTPGTLFHCLQTFHEKGINLTRIESRPTKGKPWEYIFFIDFEGHATDSSICAALGKLKEHTIFLKLLGSYPQNSQEKKARQDEIG